MSSNFSEDLAKMLLHIEAIKLNTKKPFQWASGILSPIYCDNRIALSFPEVRSVIKQGLSQLVQDNFAHTTTIAGVATAGIPHGALVADQLELPFAYVRSKAKEHGQKNAIEGKIQPNAKVVLVEDLISTGMSSLDAVEKIRAENVEVLGVIAIFTYALEISQSAFADAQCAYQALLSYPTLIDIAKNTGYISAEDFAELKKWRESPTTWKPA